MSLDRMNEIRNFIKIANENAAKVYKSNNHQSKYHKGILDVTLNSLRYIDFLILNEKRCSIEIKDKRGDVNE